MGRSSILTTTTADLDIITATGSSGSEKVGILLADFCIDGDAGSATNDCGIKWTYVDKSEIRNVWSIDNGEDGIKLVTSDYNKITSNVCQGNTRVGIYAYDSNGNAITSNVCQGNGNSGIEVTDSTEDNVIGDNVCQGNTQNGIFIDNSDYVTVNGNTCSGNGYDGIYPNAMKHSAVIGNTCKGNTLYGIYTDNSSNSNAIIGNTCQGNSKTGLFIYDANNNVVAGNTCQLNDEHGIIVKASDNNVIANNNLTESSQDTTNTYDDIYLEDAEYNTVQGNLCRAGGQTPKPRYGINISGATCDGNKVINNDLYDDGFATRPFNDDGTGTIYVEPNSTLGSTFPAVPTDGMMFCHEVTGRKILYCYDLDNTTWVPIESIGAMTLYVDKTDGSDSLEDHRTGVDGDAFATVQYAIDVIAGLVGGNVTININNEDYDEDIVIRGKSLTGDYTITLQGTLSQQDTPTMDSAVQGSGATQGSITDTGKFGSYDNMLIYANSEYRVIDSDTANVATICGCWSGVTSGTWIVYDWGTKINSITVEGGQQGIALYDIETDGSIGMRVVENSILAGYRLNLTASSYGLRTQRGGMSYLYQCYINSDSIGSDLTQFGYNYLSGCKIYTTSDGDTGCMVNLNSSLYAQHGTVIDALSQVNTDGIRILNASTASCYCPAANGYLRIRNQDEGIKAYQGGQGTNTSNNQYAGNNNDEQVIAASYGYID